MSESTEPIDRTDRHPNRGYEGWTRRLDDPLAQANKPHPPKGKKKDTRRYCNGKPSTPHQPVMVMSGYAANWKCRPGRTIWGKGKAKLDWQCWHRLVCENCGKVIDHFPPTETCPDLPKDLK